MKITVAIPTVRAATIRRAVDSVRHQTVADWELLIVAQGPDQALRAAVAPCVHEDPRVHYIHLDEMGVSRARNAAIRHARGDIVAFIDDDCEADARWLEVIAHHFEAEPELGFVVGPLVPPPGEHRWLSVCPEVRPADVLYAPSGDADDATTDFDFGGANCAIRREVALRVGPMDECLGPGTPFQAAEDLDYKSRLARAGVRMRSVSSAVVHHTFGYRYGLRAVFRHRRAYALGQGALAGKLSAGGDPRGADWLRMIRSDLMRVLRERKLARAGIALLRYWYAARAYRACLHGYTVDSDTWLLKSLADA